jgi:hypothetical protein
MNYFILERLLYYSTQTIGSLVNTAIQYKYGVYMGEEANMGLLSSGCSSFFHSNVLISVISDNNI